jgi:hypothetical protein
MPTNQESDYQLTISAVLCFSRSGRLATWNGFLCCNCQFFSEFAVFRAPLGVQYKTTASVDALFC